MSDSVWVIVQPRGKGVKLIVLTFFLSEPDARGYAMDVLGLGKQGFQALELEPIQ